MTLLKPSVTIPLKKALSGVMMGVSVGLFTPNGIGEFGGRMLVVNRNERGYAVSAAIVGSLSQLAITITVGGACLVFYISDYLLPEYRLVASIATVLTVLIGFVSYFALPRIAALLFKRIRWFNRFEKFVKSLEEVSVPLLVKAYVLSLLRYTVFCFQLILVIYLVSDWFAIFKPINAGLIPVNYYVQTLIPTVALSEIGVRSFVLSSLFQSNLLSIDLISASFLIWMVNLIVPGLVGLVAFMRYNTSKI